MYSKINRNTLKRTLLASTCLLGIFFMGCQNNDNDIWDKDPIVRLEESKQLLKQTLMDSENGWILSFSPDGDKFLGEFNMWFDFEDDWNVVVKSDLDLTDLSEEDTQYNFVVLETVALNFPLGSKVHEFTAIGPTDLRTDIEFILADYLEDGSIEFKGHTTKQKLVLKKATAEEKNFNFEKKWDLYNKLYNVSSVQLRADGVTKDLAWTPLNIDEDGIGYKWRSAQIGRSAAEFLTPNFGVVTFHALDDGSTLLLKPALELPDGTKIDKVNWTGNNFIGTVDDNYILFR